MNNAFAIGTADTELVYIITGAGAVIIARNAPRDSARDSGLSNVPVPLPTSGSRSKGERKYGTPLLPREKGLIPMRH